MIRLRRLSADGRLGPPVTAARTSDSRASGVPRLLALPGVSAAPLPMQARPTAPAPACCSPGSTRARAVRLASLAAAAVPAS